jgi:LmbE family N-acetylglucosaminyl deacetylase
VLRWKEGTSSYESVMERRTFESSRLITAALCLVFVLSIAADSEMSLNARERILVLAPHPDDEVLGCGGIIQKAVADDLPVRIVFLTYGDHNEWAFIVYRKHPVVMPGSLRRLGLIRHEEAVAAGKILGLAQDQLIFLGYPDLGTLPMWTSHWENQPAFESLLINATAVPYTNAFRPGAGFRGDEILRDLMAIISEFRPTRIFVSHPADHHPDHRALYLFATVALWNLQDGIKPEVHPYLIHYKHWPEPKGMHAALPLEPPARFGESIEWKRFALTPQMVKRNQLALEAHQTQYDYSARRLLALIRSNELYGDFPPITLRSSPPGANPSLSNLQHVQEPPNELAGQERDRVLAVEQFHAGLDRQDLLLTIEHSRLLSEATELSLFAFGYRSDQPFPTMPKLHIKVGALAHEIYNQSERLPDQDVGVERASRRTTIRIPLKSLGDPERIFVNASTWIEGLPVDWNSWRILQLEHAHAKSRTEH